MTHVARARRRRAPSQDGRIDTLVIAGGMIVPTDGECQVLSPEVPVVAG
jgi:hypothetical protein